MEASEDAHRNARTLPSLPVFQRQFIDGVQALAAVQDLQEVQPTLAFRALKAGEQIIADDGAIAVATLMSGTPV